MQLGAFDSDYPTWHIGEDFDLRAFNSSLLASIIPEGISGHVPTECRLGLQTPASQTNPCSPNEKSLSMINELWFTKDCTPGCRTDDILYSVAPTRPITPASSGNENSGLDDRYRDDLSLRLQPRWKEDPLPSTEFLNLALQLFFTKFNPIFPLIHAATFRPSQQNSLLLLSICSIGSLFMGSNGATAQGSKIFERLNKVILASWENIVTRKTMESVSLIQAAIIGQTFGYLSGNPKHLITVEAFSGTVVAWARRNGFFHPSHPILPDSNTPLRELDELWKSWAKSEEMRRTASGLYVHDSQLASMFHHDPLLRHNSIQIQAAASTELFNASSAASWAALVRSQNYAPQLLCQYQQMPKTSPPSPSQLSPQVSRFSTYVLLHGIAAGIQESRQAGFIDAQDMCQHRDALIHWYHAYESGNCEKEPDPFCLMILWHESFMSLLVDFDKLERAIGRDGPSGATQVSFYTEQWASSIHAKRVAIHASLIHQRFGNMRVASEPAIHVPRSMFLAAIAWYCYIKFGVEDSPAVATEEVLDCPELKILNINPSQHLFEASGFTKGKPTAVEASPLLGRDIAKDSIQ
ncbi:uncharacterized protein PAC_13180 [Phialocephala subalpina]|uniref:Xylanolytic transcriptional activator regulatory domain-containing protein n=1 Tax=Phialocephala subalpina TaxID=576137 RepID=A0A1L7XE43_9HELO|nr:uncharacterized protein PAC_13180 [Phialocephala subalpina]